MDVEELRCISQVNGNYSENTIGSSIFYHDHNLTGYDESVLDIALLTPCEFCNRTFLPTSLNKHKRGCYKSWLKMKERESQVSNDHDKSQHGLGFFAEKPILTIEQMLAKRRQRRLNWRLRHEEFMRAVHAARDYAEAVATGNPLPPPLPPIVEPDLKQCPHCHRKFHEKSIDRHIIRCKEQSIRNTRERPSFQTMEAKRRLAVRLYYQPNSRPNSSLSLSNSEPPANLSRPSSRQSEFEYGRNIESANSYNIGRHSSLSVMDRNELKLKLPSSVLENLHKRHDRLTPRHSFNNFRNSQNNTPNFNNGSATPNNFDQFSFGRKSNLSRGVSRNSSSQSIAGNLSEIESFSKRINEYQAQKGNNPGHRRNIRRSTSCISQIHPTSNNKSDLKSTDNSTKNNLKIYNHKPFSCSQSPQKETRISKELSRSGCQINRINDASLCLSRNRNKEERHNTFNQTIDNIFHNLPASRSSSGIDKSENTVNTIINKSNSRNVHASSEMKLSQHVNETFRKKCNQKPDIITNNKRETIKKEELDSLHSLTDVVTTEVNENQINYINRHVQNLSYNDVNRNILKSEVDKIPKSDNITLSPKYQSSIPVSGNRVRNEIQIRIKSHTKPDVMHKIRENERESQNTDAFSNMHHNGKIINKLSNSLLVETDKRNTSFRQIDSKGECPSPTQNLLRFISNCNLIKSKEQAQGDNTYIPAKNVNKVEEIKNINLQSPNFYQSKSIKSVSIYDQNTTSKFRSSISLQDSINRTEDNTIRNMVSNDFGQFCQECGHRFPALDARFCCSCGSKRMEIMLQK